MRPLNTPKITTKELNSGGGGGVLEVRIPPFWRIPKLHELGKNIAHAQANA